LGGWGVVATASAEKESEDDQRDWVGSHEADCALGRLPAGAPLDKCHYSVRVTGCRYGERRPAHQQRLGDAVLKGFREFITKGNVIDLAVAVVIGAAFTTVINAVVEGLITPLIAAIFGEPNLNEVGTFTINGAVFSIGIILTALINFLLVAAAVYFVLVAPMNAYREMRARGEEEEPEAPPEDLLVLLEIRDLIRDRRGAV